MPNDWVKALKLFNNEQQYKKSKKQVSTFTIPKKNSTQYNQVKKIEAQMKKK
jgi:hypothetical protein